VCFADSGDRSTVTSDQSSVHTLRHVQISIPDFFAEYILTILSNAMRPKPTITFGRRIWISCSRYGWQLSNSSMVGLLSGGTQRAAAAIYKSFKVRPSLRDTAVGWSANPARYSAGYKNPPDASPVNGRPVLFEPCAPGARPTTRIRACGSPNPGTGLPQYSWSLYALRLTRATSSRQATRRSHLRHAMISLLREVSERFIR